MSIADGVGVQPWDRELLVSNNHELNFPGTALIVRLPDCAASPGETASDPAHPGIPEKAQPLSEELYNPWLIHELPHL